MNNNIEDEIEREANEWFLKNPSGYATRDLNNAMANGKIKGFKAGYKAALQQQPNVSSEWISVENDLPRMNRVVLVYIPQQDFGLRTLGYYVEDGWYSGVSKITEKFIGKVTHWMPLPAPPNEAQSEQSNESEDEYLEQANLWCEVVYKTLKADKEGQEVGNFIPNVLEKSFSIKRK